MNMLLYPEIHQGWGTGNVVRMVNLCHYLKRRLPSANIHISCNDVGALTGIARSLHDTDIEPSVFNNEGNVFDVVLYDSALPDKEKLACLRQRTKKLIALDFFQYETTDVDVIVNLFNQHGERAGEFFGHLYEGVQYAILKDEILHARGNDAQLSDRLKDVDIRILVTFGGEDPQQHTRMVLEQLNMMRSGKEHIRVRVLLGERHRDKAQIMRRYTNMEISGPTASIGRIMANSDLVICGGGTTVLESLYVGTPTIAIPQNEYEHHFVENIRKHAPLFELEQLVPLLQEIKDPTFRSRIQNRYHGFIDGDGKERITRIALGCVD